MRVLVLTVVHHPLDARIHHRQVTALLDAGHEVVYAAPFTGYGVPRDEVDPRVVAVDVPRATRWARLSALRQARSCLRSRAGDVDVAILHDPELLLAGAGLARRLPIIWDVHEDLAASFDDKTWVPRWLVPALRDVVRRLERWAEGTVTLMLAEEGYRARFRGEHPVVPNLPPLPPRPRGPEDDRVVYVGRVSRLRGALELAEVGEALAGAGLRLEVMGSIDGDVEDHLRRAEHAGHLHLEGFVRNDSAMARLDGALAGLSLLHDHENYRHSLPTKVVEYQAAGVPVVTTPLAPAVDLVERCRSGLVVPFADPSAAVEAILALADDRPRARRLGAAGRAAAEAGLSWDAAAPAFVRFVEDVAQSRA